MLANTVIFKSDAELRKLTEIKTFCEKRIHELLESYCGKILKETEVVLSGHDANMVDTLQNILKIIEGDKNVSS